MSLIAPRGARRKSSSDTIGKVAALTLIKLTLQGEGDRHPSGKGKRHVKGLPTDYTISSLQDGSWFEFILSLVFILGGGCVCVFGWVF